MCIFVYFVYILCVFFVFVVHLYVFFIFCVFVVYFVCICVYICATAPRRAIASVARAKRFSHYDVIVEF